MTSPSFDLRIESRFKNAPLYNAMAACCTMEAEKRRKGARYPLPLISVLAEMSGVAANSVRMLLNLKDKPRNKNGDYSGPVLAICRVLNADPEELFPGRLYALALPSVAVTEVDSLRFLSLGEARRELITDGGLNESIDKQRRDDALSVSLNAMKPQRREVMNMRFGLDGEGPLTQSECGERLGVSAGRVRQIEAAALRELRGVKGLKVWR